MEEHCPHGSGNAVFCNECEREDKKRAEASRKKAQKEKDLAAEFMELAKGLPARKVIRIMDQHMPGMSYVGSSKKSMAEDYATGGACGIKLRDRNGLKKALKEAPRATPVDKKARARLRLIATKVKRLGTHEAVHGMRSKEMKALLLETDDDVLESYYGAIENERAEALRLERSARAEAKRLQSHSLVVDKEIRRRRRNKK